MYYVVMKESNGEESVEVCKSHRTLLLLTHHFSELIERVEDQDGQLVIVESLRGRKN